MIGIKLTLLDKVYKIGPPDSEDSLVIVQVEDRLVIEGFAYRTFKVGFEFEIEIEEFDEAIPISREGYIDNCDYDTEALIKREPQLRLNRYKELSQKLKSEGLI